MTRHQHHTLAAVDTDVDAVEFTTVARILTDAAVLVRTRTERGDSPASDQRPRILDAIDRAATVVAGAAGRLPRDWAIVLAAMQINAALDRGRYRDDRDVTAATWTLAGFGLDVGTLRAVVAAADLLSSAGETARRIGDAAPVPVHRYGTVVAYPLGAIHVGDVDADDIVTTDHPQVQSGGPVNLRVLHVRTAVDGTRSLLLDTDHGPEPWPTDRDQPGTQACVTAWRPVPHRRHPWPPR